MSDSSDPPLAPEVAHLGFLLGTWRGEGRGQYPTIAEFEYREETVFGHAGKPFLTFVQRTRHLDDTPLHTESGYLRPVGTDRVEFVLSIPSGIMESLEGTVSGTTLDLTSVAVVGTATAKDVEATTRSYSVEADTLTYDIAMAAVGQPLTHHLHADLQRKS